MGIIPCRNAKDQNDVLHIIEKSIKNKKTTLDKKIFEEYYNLKNIYKPQKKVEKNNSKEKEIDNFPMMTKKNNFISIKKRMDRFIKWYFMSHPNQNPNLKNKRSINSENKITTNNLNKEINLNNLNICFDNPISNLDNATHTRSNCNPPMKKNPSDGNLRSSLQRSSFINPLSNLEENDYAKNNEQGNLNNTTRVKNINKNNNEISPISNDKKVQFILENEKGNQNFNNTSSIRVNLNNRFSPIPIGNISNNSGNNNNISSNNNNNDEICSSFLNIQVQNIFRNNLQNNNNNIINNNFKLGSTLTMPNLSAKNNNFINQNIENICNSNSLTKIKLLKNDASIKIIQKSEAESSNEINLNSININCNNSSSRNSNLQTISNNNQNLNSNSNSNNNINNNMMNNINNSYFSSLGDSDLNRKICATSRNNNNYYNSNLINNTNNKNSNSNVNSNSEDLSSKSNNDKSTTARLNNKNNTLSKTTTLPKEDSNPNSQAEKNIIFNNFYNSSQDNDQNSNSICQQLNIFDDSNIIESNLRLSFKLNKEKFSKRALKGPPDSFRWISWLITSNLPFERSKEFYNFLLKQQLNSEVDIQIKKDLNRTLSGIKISNFILDDTQLILYNILKAFSLVDKEVSYCQGMNFIVGFLLIMSDFNEIETFYLMLSLFSKTFKDNLCIRGFFLEGFPLLNFYVSLFLTLFSKNLPELKKHFEKLEIPDEIWIAKWFRTLFTLSLPFNICMRIWDCLIISGLDFLLNFTLAFMKYLEQDLLKKQDLFDVIEYFKKISPFFAMENEGEENLIAESVKFVETFNIEEIILNARKIKISHAYIQEQMQIFEKTHNVCFEKLKIKYDLSYCNIDNSHIQFENNDEFNFQHENNNNDDFSEYSFNGEKRNNEYYINTETCRSEIEKIKNNLDPQNINIFKTPSNLNLSNILNINMENNLQKIKSSESNRNVTSTININHNNQNVGSENDANFKNVSKNYNEHNFSGNLEISPTNSDTDLNADDDIQDKIISYTFKAKVNINKNENNNLTKANRLFGKID